jgi:hypothetical protein
MKKSRSHSTRRGKQRLNNLVIAALLFGFRGLDNMLGEFGRDSGVLRK